MRINWYRSKVDPDVMRQLCERSDARALIHVGAQLGLYALTGTAAWLCYRHIDAANWLWTVPLLLLCLFLHGTNGSFFGGVACHELGHKTPFATARLNAFFLRVYAFLSWFEPTSYRASHSRHHQSTTHADDDGEVVLPLIFDYRSIPFFLSAIALHPPSVWRQLRFMVAAAQGDLTREGFFRSEWLRRVVPESDAKTRHEIIRWARIVVGGHLLLATVFVLSGNWFLVVLITFGCLYSNWLTILTGLPQHFGLKPNTPDFRICCRTYTCHWVPAFFYWNMQYHVEHHMFPAVPFYHLPRLRAAIAHDLPPATHGLLATWKHEMLPIIRQQRVNPNYMVVPPLPKNEGVFASDSELYSEAGGRTAR